MVFYSCFSSVSDPDPDPKPRVTDPDPDPAKCFGSLRIRIHKTGSKAGLVHLNASSSSSIGAARLLPALLDLSPGGDGDRELVTDTDRLRLRPRDTESLLPRKGDLASLGAGCEPNKIILLSKYELVN
jgi:hypothetical protein